MALFSASFEHMRAKPGMYFHPLSVHSIFNLLLGYEHALLVHGIEGDPHSNQLFYQWLSHRLGRTNTMSWPGLLLEDHEDGPEAVRAFLDHYEAYLADQA